MRALTKGCPVDSSALTGKWNVDGLQRNRQIEENATLLVGMFSKVEINIRLQRWTYIGKTNDDKGIYNQGVN